MIKDEDISIVVQGAILATSSYDITATTTKMVCLRLRQLFPQSELILSTWVGETVDHILFDKVIFNPDPGAAPFVYQDDTQLNNGNRMIVSTLAGIRAASRKYVLKLRSDLFVVSKNFLKYFYRYHAYNDHYRIVDQRILAFGIFSVQAEKQCSHRNVPFPYHVSDWAYFGYQTDMLKLYDIPLMPEPDFSQWFAKRYKPYVDSYRQRLWQMTPEQYVTSTFFKKYFAITFEYSADISHHNQKLSTLLITNNFMILDQTQFGLISLKYVNFQLLFKPILAQTAIFYHTWLQNYYRHSAKRNELKKIYHRIIIWQRYIFCRTINLLFRHFEENFSRLIGFFIKKWILKQLKSN